tara:strand:- start:1108 stop:1251 length:144 start_codon:yes stop_codon:yes gene_type:complete
MKKMIKMNKKAHHEAGFAPYALLIAIIGAGFIYFKSLFTKLFNYRKK